MSIQIASSDPVSADIKKGPLANVVEISSTAISNDAASDNDQLPKQLVDAMQAIFGKHQGYRTTHAKGLLVEGTFTPTKEAKDLSTAAHFNNCSTKVIARFSVGGGLPHVADVSDGATPKGVAIRFQVDDNTHTDLISHSFNGFATRNGEDFLTFLKLFGADGRAEVILKEAKAVGGDTSKEQKAYDEAHASFLSFLKKPENQSAAVFVGSEKPKPHNYGTITYYEPNTHILTNKNGKVTNVRYRLDPADGVHLYPNKTPEDKQKLAQLGNDYLEDNLQQRFPDKPVIFTIQAHVADPNDVLDDATKPYKSTAFIPVGRLEINKVSADNVAQQQQIAFSPNPEKGGIEGIKASNDPLIQARKGVYWISADQRRNEKQVEQCE
ncbi:catalase-like domain-containing protein [Fusarium flagelliforme]|uniref:catalase-like domain-containing protein n=1 Tax=Fusarium flagelliforme TaxID=2675880 RepID=UPI001E8D9A8F|nr:catalase-like domain-containing protein [Fusarium flagelliforme]KAH7191719.1 catalase-like domain-containing protein [Fusarium flagelliforme]